MIQSVYQGGLRVESAEPASGSLGASIYTLIRLTFNSELNTGSILNNVMVFEDPNGRYVDMDTIRATPALFPKIEGNYTYKDRVITFTPASMLKNSTKYIVAVKADGITDIYGNRTVAEQSFHFITEADDVEARVNITTPQTGQVCSQLPEIAWSTVGSTAYYIEVSRQQTFENTVFATAVPKNPETGLTPLSYRPDLDLPDGMYYLRVKALKGPWSLPVQIFVKRMTEALTSKEDLAEIIDQLNLEDAPAELLESFPPTNEANVSERLRCLYFKFKGYLDFEAVNLWDSSVEMLPAGSTTGIPEDVPGQWIHVYDNREDVTYLIFQIEK